MRDGPRLVGINHIALEVGDLEEALSFYASVFEFELRGQVPGMAFLDMGDQFIAMSEGRRQPPDDARHFGLVVDSLEAAGEALTRVGADVLPGRGLDFRDPWGNHVQLVEYGEIQFTKTDGVLEAMGLSGVEKSDSAKRELYEKGFVGDEPGGASREGDPG